MANVQLKRRYKKSNYTIGDLYINGKWVCNTLEDTDRGLTSSMSAGAIQKKKVYAQTAIPTGTYQMTLNVVSPKFSSKEFYKTTCAGRLPRLLNVPGFSGILIHVGNTAADSAGCILVGYNRVKGKVVDSKTAYTQVYSLLEKEVKKGKNLVISIQ